MCNKTDLLIIILFILIISINIDFFDKINTDS